MQKIKSIGPFRRSQTLKSDIKGENIEFWNADYSRESKWTELDQINWRFWAQEYTWTPFP